MTAFGITMDEADRITDDVMKEVKRRAKVYAGSDQPPEIAGKHVILVDDGLATGFTTLVAAKMVREHEPASLTLAVPCSPVQTLNAINGRIDATYCIFAQKGRSFAVASYYRDFHDMSDGEVRAYLEERLPTSRRPDDVITRKTAADEA